MQRRNIRVQVLVLVMALLLLVPGAQAKTKITMWLGSQSEEVKPWLRDFVDQFNEENPDIELEMTLHPWVTAMREKVIVASAGGAGPDIYSEGSNVIAMYVSNGLARPIDDLLEKTPDKADFIGDIMRDLTYNGHVYAFPYSLRPYVDAYNMNLFQASGANDPRTWDELIQATRKITRVDSSGAVEINGYAAIFSAGIYDYIDFETYMAQLGATSIQVGAKTATMNNPSGRRVLEYMSDLFRYGMPDRQSRNLGSFMNGKVGVFHWAPLGHQSLMNVIPESGLPDQTEFRRYVGPTPGTDSVQYIANTLLINSGTKHPEEAWRVVRAMTSQASIKGYLMAQGLELSPRKSLFADYDLLSRPFVKEATALLSSRLVPLGSRHMLYTDFRKPAGDFLAQAIYGDLAVQNALEQAEQAINAVILDKGN